jgi:hypothetical protein
MTQHGVRVDQPPSAPRAMRAEDGFQHEPGSVPSGRHAAEMGLASLFLGAVLFLGAPLALILAVLVWQFADKGPGVVLLHAWLARVGVLIALLAAAASVGFGVWGVRTAVQRGQPKGLSLGGLLLSLAALGLWVVAAIGLLNTTESLLHQYGR